MHLPPDAPVMVLPGTTLFPQAMLPLYIFEPRYRQMLKAVLASNRMFCIAMRRPAVSRNLPCPVASLGLVRAAVDHKDGTSHLVLQGLTRVRLGAVVQSRPYRIQRISALPTAPCPAAVSTALVERIRGLVHQRVHQLGLESPVTPQPPGQVPADRASAARELLRYLDQLPNADHVADLVSCALLRDPIQRQLVLECIDLEDRLRHIAHFLLEDITLHDAPPDPEL